MEARLKVAPEGMSTEAVPSATKKCPFCAEAVLAEALKCKHCGERLDGSPHTALAASPAVTTPGKRNNPLLRHLPKILGTVLGIGIVAAAVVLLPDSRLWVRLHSDVRWHRDWQDARTGNSQERVRTIYADWAKAKPDDPELLYLWLRTLESGREKLSALEAAVAKFPKSGWLLWAHGHTLKEMGETSAGLEKELAALQLFEVDEVAVVVPLAIGEASEAADWDTLKRIYASFKAPVNSSAEAALAMSRAEFRRGNHKSALEWDERAREFGAGSAGHTTRVIAKMKAVGLRPSFVGDFGMAAMHGSHSVEIVDLGLDGDGDSARLVVWVRYQHFARENAWMDGDRFAFVTNDGRWIKSESTWSESIRPGEKTPKYRLLFTITGKDEVDRFVYDTGFKIISSGEKVVVVIPSVGSGSKDSGEAANEDKEPLRPE